MRTVNYLVGLAATLFLLAACQSDTYCIKGEARQFNDGTVLYLTSDLNDGHPQDSAIVADGYFSLCGTADTTLLCRLYPQDAPDTGVLFFLEPGNIYIELSNEPDHIPADTDNRSLLCSYSRVSGTKINNEWQALNDTVAKYDLSIRNIFSNDSLSPRQKHAAASRYYQSINRCIAETAKRNSDNALGRFISYHRQNN